MLSGDKSSVVRGLMKNHRALVVAFDENYLMPGLVAAKTALGHSPRDTRLIILSVGLSRDAKEQIADVISSERLTIVDADEYTTDMREWRYVSAAAGARIGIGSLLSREIKRVVYLDADTFTRKDLTVLFDVDLEGKILGACAAYPDATHRVRHIWGKQQEPELDYGSDCPVPDIAAYFNSGVLAIDLDRWRQKSVESRLADFISTLLPSYLLPDQDALNTVLWNDWLPLSGKLWNWPGFVLDRLAWETHIVHFSGPTKLWVSDPVGAPFSREYRKAARSVGWKLHPPRHRVRTGLLEAVLPYSIVLRRREISRAIRGWALWR